MCYSPVMSGYPSDDGLMLIEEVFSGGYDWCLISLWYSPVMCKYFLYEDGGCSCDDPYNYYKSLADMKQVTYAQGKNAIEAFKRADNYDD